MITQQKQPLMRALRRSHTSSAPSPSSNPSTSSPSTASSSSSSSSSSWIHLRSVFLVVAPSSSSPASSNRGGLKSPWSRRRRKHSLLPKQWISLFLPDGKLCDGGVKFLKKVRSGGVDPSIRVEVWPFLLGVYDLNSSQEERDAVKKQNRKQYEILRKQCKQITRRNEKGSGSKENTGYSSEFSGEISHGGCSSELSGEIIHGGGYNSEFSGEISQVLDPIVEDSLPENPKEDAVRSVSNERESSVSQKPKEESLSSNGSLSSEKEGSVSDNPIEEPAVDLDGSLSNGRDDSGSDRTQTFQREGSVSQNLMEGTPKIKDRVEPVDSREPLSKEIVERGVSENLVEESGPSYVTKNIDCGGTDKPGQSSPTEVEVEVEVEGEGSLLDKSEVTSDSTISESPDSDELEYLPPLFSSSELEGADADGNPSELKTSTTKSHTNEDFTTWQRIIRLDAVRANDEWIIYSPSQANVTQMKARRLARSVGLKDFDHLDACRVFHAARLVAILEAYAIYDPEIGYCQGMSDLLSPLVSVIEDDDMAFWCFVGFMKKARHNFRLDEVGIRSQLNLVSKIIKCKDSHLYSHLEKLQAEDCFFVYRMVVVLFRRELDFDQTLCLWEVIWADQAAIRAGIARSAWRRMRLRAPPTDDLLLFAIAACVLQRRKLIIEKYSSMEEIMRECNSMAGQLDVWKLLDDAHDLVVNLHEKIYKQTT